MPITISGSGTISGISAGGLPDAIITTDEVADASITASKLSGASSGSAPIYGARAWVNFNGTGTVAIRASGNVSSITDRGVGQYTVNLTTWMLDANYATNLSVRKRDATEDGNMAICLGSTTTAYSTSSVAVTTRFISNEGLQDAELVSVSIFR